MRSAQLRINVGANGANQWLLQEQVNGAIQEEPTYEVDISCRPAKDRVPVGYDYAWQGEELVIRRVKINGAYPTRIELKNETRRAAWAAHAEQTEELP